MKTLLTILSMCLATLFCRAQTFDPAWASLLQTTLDNTANNYGIRGASAAVYAPGMGTWTGVTGESSAGVPIQPDMLFGFGSNTKLFIAALMLKLQENGVLSINDPIDNWLPSFPYIDSSATIRQLLSHQTGFFDYLNDNPSLWMDSIWVDTSRFWTPLELMATLGPPHFAVGDGFLYSNTNYLLAGMIIESATGQPFHQQLRTLILDPLGLDSTFSGAFEPIPVPIAHPWVGDTLEIIANPMTAEFSQGSAAGCILSTPSEMAGWYYALFSGQVLTQASLDEIMDFEPITQYGLGLILEVTQTGTIYDHSGGALAFTSFMIYDPVRDITLSLAMNTRTNTIAMVQNMFYALTSGFPQVPDDIAAAEIVSPYARGCLSNLSPEIVLLNNGINPVTTATIHYTVDNGPVTTFAWSGNLAPGATVQVTLPYFTAFAGNRTLKCYTRQPNGNQDGFARNDTVETAFIVDSLTVSGYMLEDFEGPVFPAPGSIVAPQEPLTWDRTTLVSANGDACLVKNLYFDWQVGNIYDFDLPYYDVTGMNNPVMEFKLAYALFPNIFDDTLQVLVSADCGLTWQVLHSEGGMSMNTGGVTQAMYFPLSSDWETRQVSLSGYTGSLHFRFRAISGFGNNLFIDDIVVSDATALAENGNNSGSRVSVYPNPVTVTATVVTGSSLLNGALRIYDQTGRLVGIREQLRGKRHTFDKGDLKSGMYFFTVTDNGTDHGSGKFIIN